MIICFRHESIANEILMQIRASKKIQNEVSLQDPIGIDKEGNEIPPTCCILTKSL